MYKTDASVALPRRQLLTLLLVSLKNIKCSIWCGNYVDVNNVFFLYFLQSCSANQIQRPVGI